MPSCIRCIEFTSVAQRCRVFDINSIHGLMLNNMEYTEMLHFFLLTVYSVKTYIVLKCLPYISVENRTSITLYTG